MIEPIDIGDDPIPNHGVNDIDFGPVEGYQQALDEEHFGSPLKLVNKTVTAVLRPDFSRWYDLIEKTGGNWTEKDADHMAEEGRHKQQATLDYFNGKTPLSQVVGLWGGGIRGALGVIEPDEIRDLGA